MRRGARSLERPERGFPQHAQGVFPVLRTRESRPDEFYTKKSGLPKPAARFEGRITVDCLLWPAIHHLLTHVLDVLVEGLLLIVGENRLQLITLLLLQLAALRPHFLRISAP